MSEPGPNEEPFVRAVRRQAERSRASRQLSLWAGLSLVGAVGWMVSLPAVLGLRSAASSTPIAGRVAIGRWRCCWRACCWAAQAPGDT